MFEETNGVNIQAKKMLAKLLATESITVIHAGTRTASFDPKRRILTLPIWKEMSGDLYDLFVLHEVSHALYTPQGSKSLIDACNRVDPKYPKVAKRFINIVEDARIERLIKVTYPGGRGAFIRGYNELVARNFFGTQGQDINNFGIIDRINIYFKTGNTDIKFSGEEIVFIREIEKVLTFDEVVRICERLYKYAKAERDKKVSEVEEPEAEEKGKQGEENGEEANRKSKSSFGDDKDDDSDVSIDPDADVDEYLPDDKDSENESGDSVEADETGEKDEDDKEAAGDGEDEDSEDEETNSDEESDEDQRDSKTLETPKAKTTKVNDDPVESVTDKTWEEKQEELCDDKARPIHYLGVPKPKLSAIIIPYKKVHDDIRKHYLKYCRKENSTFITQHEAEFSRFKEENKPVIDWLIKEFEMHKAADQYAKTLVSKTGVLDMNKLNQYRFADDIMKKVTSIVGGKNHALEIFVDWSGSMAKHILGTVHQLINIAIFCRKEQIPFNAYTFGAKTAHSRECYAGPYGAAHGNSDVFQFEIDDFGFYDGFSLRQMLSSTMFAAEFNDACVDLLMLASSCDSNLPKSEQMGGTPLNEAIVAAIEIVIQLRKKTNIQVVNTVFITDGEATTDGKYIINEFGQTTHIDYSKEDVYLRDSVTHIDYPLSGLPIDTTKAFLQILRNCTRTNAVGFFISGGDRASQKEAIAKYCPERWAKGKFEQNKIEKELEENNFVLVPNMGYSEFYIIPGGRELCISLPGSPLTSIMGNGQLITALTRHGLAQRKQRICLTRFIKMIS